jgi:polyisoprenyl-phosphate glycosyltransferase
MEDNKTRKISLVVPCFNEEANIPVLYQHVREVLADRETEFVFVDDCSTDGTLSVLEALAAGDPSVKYVSFSRNFGHQSALRAGLEYATGDCVISLDADMQHPPELLPEMIGKWNEGYDMVVTLRQDTAKLPWFKRLTSSLFYKIINALSEVNIQKGAADFRLIDRKIVDVLVHDITEYHLFYRGMINWIGFRQTAIPYVPNARFSGNTKYSFRKMLNLALDGVTSFSIKPLKFAIILGLLLAAFSAVYALFALAMSLFTDQTVRGWTSVILSILFIGGVNMILLGIIGEYVGKIYMQVKNRPHFLVKKTNAEIPGR